MKEEANEPALIQSAEDFISRVRRDSLNWPHVWFRGETD